jgi:hypothetical protein
MGSSGFWSNNQDTHREQEEIDREAGIRVVSRVMQTENPDVRSLWVLQALFQPPHGPERTMTGHVKVPPKPRKR